jgi:hypothetical protein
MTRTCNVGYQSHVRTICRWCVCINLNGPFTLDNGVPDFKSKKLVLEVSPQTGLPEHSAPGHARQFLCGPTTIYHQDGRPTHHLLHDQTSAYSSVPRGGRGRQLSRGDGERGAGGRGEGGGGGWVGGN